MPDGERQLVVRKPAGGELGVVWEAGTTRVDAVEEGSAMAAAGGAAFVGRVAVAVNGRRVALATDIAPAGTEATPIPLPADDGGSTGSDEGAPPAGGGKRPLGKDD
eukprot:gene1951-5497_t